jgi:hypothetical protein
MGNWQNKGKSDRRPHVASAGVPTTTFLVIALALGAFSNYKGHYAGIS